jgi:hypothetical protein
MNGNELVNSRYLEWDSAVFHLYLTVPMEIREQSMWIGKILSEYLEGDLDKLGLRGLHYTSWDDRQGGVPHTCTEDKCSPSINPSQ